MGKSAWILGALGAYLGVLGDKAQRRLSSVWMVLDLKAQVAGPSYFRQWEPLRSFGPGQLEVEAREEAEAAGWGAGCEGRNQGDRHVDGALETDERGQQDPRACPSAWPRPGCLSSRGGRGCQGFSSGLLRKLLSPPVMLLVRRP